MITFYILMGAIIFQRCLELIIARRNEKWMKEMGGKEYGQEHYKFIVLVHMLFLFSFIFEVQFYEKTLSPIWPALLGIFIATQFLRAWSIKSLGRFWNTKIIVLPDVCIISKGPYKYIRHPNYLVVAIEIFLIPLFFNAFITAFVFSIINAVLMLIRIPVEEKALMMETNYRTAFLNKPRFSPQKTTK